VTIDIGVNDLCAEPASPQCPVADNLRAILTTLNDALARDPGDETLQIMEYYNRDLGTRQEGATRQNLLGTDLKVDCSGTGSAVGLNDVIHCIGLEKNAVPVTSCLPSTPAAPPSWPLIIRTRATPATARSRRRSAAPSALGTDHLREEPLVPLRVAAAVAAMAER
jgi:hypothetical protein